MSETNSFDRSSQRARRERVQMSDLCEWGSTQHCEPPSRGGRQKGATPQILRAHINSIVGGQELRKRHNESEFHYHPGFTYFQEPERAPHDPHLTLPHLLAPMVPIRTIWIQGRIFIFAILKKSSEDDADEEPCLDAKCWWPFGLNFQLNLDYRKSVANYMTYLFKWSMLEEKRQQQQCDQMCHAWTPYGSGIGGWRPRSPAHHAFQYSPLLPKGSGYIVPRRWISPRKEVNIWIMISQSLSSLRPRPVSGKNLSWKNRISYPNYTLWIFRLTNVDQC